jgi:hypothetical protein
MISIAAISKACAVTVVVCCAYMAAVDTANQIVWLIALIGWIGQVFD